MVWFDDRVVQSKERMWSNYEALTRVKVDRSYSSRNSVSPDTHIDYVWNVKGSQYWEIVATGRISKGKVT